MELEESLQVELKEFFVDLDETEDQSIYEEAILKGIMYSNDLILKTLRKNFVKYLPKYLSCWNNEELGIEYGTMYFGIKDDGEIAGIPYQGKLSREIVSNLILEIIPFIKDKDKLELINKISFEIIPVKPIKFDIMKECNLLINNHKKSVEKNRQCLKKYYEWHYKIKQWSCKLIDILNIREKRIKFLHWVVNNCNAVNKEDIIKQILNWQYLKDFYVCVSEEKHNKKSMIYWLCTFKDIMSSKKFPKPIIHPINNINWMNFYSSPAKMNYHIKENNKNVNFYVIKMELPNLKRPVIAKFKNKWKRFYRTIDHLGPSSIPMDEYIYQSSN